MNGPIGSTLPLAVACAMLAGCGASQKEIQTARSSGYEADFAVVYSNVLEVVREHYPGLSENASSGVIKTQWHPININREGTEDGLTPQQRDALRRQQRNDPNMGTAALGGSNLARTRFFIRFDIHVLGGKPWRVRIRGQASEWELGAVPVELKGADEPHWLQGRIDALYVEIYDRLEDHAVPLETRVVGEDEVEEEKVDLSVYGQLPEPAAAVIHQVATAVSTRDYAALRPLMAQEFRWSLGGDASADQALVMWQADSSTLDALAGVLEAGCVAATDVEVICPGSAAPDPEASGFLGHYAVFEPQGGSWKMTAFLRQE